MGRRRTPVSTEQGPTKPSAPPAIVGLTESFVLLTEFILLSSLLATCVRSAGFGSGLGAISAAILSLFLLLSWILYRNWSSYQISFRAYFQLLGLIPFRISSWTISFLAFQLCSHAVLLWIHDFYGSHAVSWRNLQNALGGLDWTRVVELGLVAPIREELVFRGVMLLVIHRRLPHDKLSVVLGPSILFSLSHLVNFGSATYSLQYVCVQLVVSLLISMFYSVRVISTGSLWDAILLHCVNNILACFVKLSPDVDLIMEPLLFLPLIQTIVIFSVVLLSTWTSLDVAFDHYTRSRVRVSPSHDLYQDQDPVTAS